MTRDLFVFSGQSNMMGAAALEPKHNLAIKNSFEFKYKNEYLGRGKPTFEKVSYNCGEFLYCDKQLAYPDNENLSSLADYQKNTYFVPAMCSKERPFSYYSESNYTPGPCIIPYFCEFMEKNGRYPLVSHISKGAVKIEHFFTDSMARDYNSLKVGKEIQLTAIQKNAGIVLGDKIHSFFEHSRQEFATTGKKIFVWLQGEDNADDSLPEYKAKLGILFKKLKNIGFDYMFIIRVGYWGNKNILNVIKAQEEFCRENPDCFMVTRSISFMPNTNMPKDWFKTVLPEFENCRDTYYGYENSHINEKGFLIAAEYMANNACRILENKAPLEEAELLKV